MPKKEKALCCAGYHQKKGAGMIVFGLIVLINAYWPFLSWDVFVGLALVLAGILKISKRNSM